MSLIQSNFITIKPVCEYGMSLIQNSVITIITEWYVINLKLC